MPANPTYGSPRPQRHVHFEALPGSGTSSRVCTPSPPPTPPVPMPSHDADGGPQRSSPAWGDGVYPAQPTELSMHAMTQQGRHARAPQPVRPLGRRPRQPIEPTTTLAPVAAPPPRLQRAPRPAWAPAQGAPWGAGPHGPQPEDERAHRPSERPAQPGEGPPPLRGHAPSYGDLGTEALEAAPEPSWLQRHIGAVQRCIDALRPVERRHENDSRRLARWLRDQGIVEMDAEGHDHVVVAVREGSSRLKRLGMLNERPNLHGGHVEAVQQVLAARVRAQGGAQRNDQAPIFGLTEQVRDALPKARRPR